MLYQEFAKGSCASKPAEHLYGLKVIICSPFEFGKSCLGGVLERLEGEDFVMVASGFRLRSVVIVPCGASVSSISSPVACCPFARQFLLPAECREQLKLS